MPFKSDPEIRKKVHPFLYLFIMDICCISFQDFKAYEGSEPGFAAPFIHAYIEAFKEDMNGQLSHALLQKINKDVMSHMPEGFGQYRKIPGCFRISFEDYQRDEKSPKMFNFTYNATLKGLKEFISYWIIEKKSHHLLHFKQTSDSNTNTLFIFSKNKKTYCCSGMYNISKKDEFHAKRDFALIKKLTSTIGHEVFINTMWLLPELKVRIQDEVEQGMQQIFDEFHEEIASAVDKIPVIAKCIQHIDQLHPFVDGNIRTCYVLLNKLLSDYGLPLTILLNPNKLDACSLDEVIQMIRDGQVIYQQLINNTDPNQFVVKTNEKILELQSIICPPNDLNLQKLLGAFYRSFIHREQGSGLSKATAQRFFSSNKDFSCALRNACNKRELGIITELLGSNKTIDVNQQSSNGNTALDWFDKSGVAVEHDLFKEVREILVAKGALNNKFVPSMPVSPK